MVFNKFKFNFFFKNKIKTVFVTKIKAITNIIFFYVFLQNKISKFVGEVIVF